MALQTHSASSSSASPTTSSAPNQPGVSFSPAGSPPLILAFLAIGLFSVATIIVFGWRRVYGRPFTLGSIPSSPHLVKAPYVLPAKPRLWEPWAADETTWQQVSGRVARPGYHTGEWGRMTPLAARPISPDELLVDSDTDKIENGYGSQSRRSTSSLRTALLDPQFQSHWRTWWRRSGREEPMKETSQVQARLGESTPSSRKLQVGVIIILPSAQHPIYAGRRTGESNEHRTRQGFREFAIGVRELEWEPIFEEKEKD